MNLLSTTTLQQYLRDRLIILGILIALIYGYAMSSLYSWGLDDAAEFYLYQDAETVEALISQGLPLPANTLNKKFFIGVGSLPEKYRRTINTSIIQPVISHIESDNLFDYILSYPLKESTLQNKKTILFVIHTFDLEEDESVPGLSTLETTLIVSAIALAFILLTASLIYRSISRAVNTLYRWGNTIGKSNSTVKTNNLPIDTLRFSELQSVGKILYGAINKIISSTEREKLFVRCLSHELRTPMAVTSAALDILDKKELNYDIQKKTKKIRDANRKMISISDTLLSIWQEKDHNHYPEEVNIFDLANEVIQDNQYIAANPNVSIIINITPSFVIELAKQPFSIILTNLVKNALQYTHAGFIRIEIEDGKLVVTNSYSMNSVNKHTARSEYGFGLGLFIAETVADQQSWLLNCSQKDGGFRSELVFC